MNAPAPPAGLLPAVIALAERAGSAICTIYRQPDIAASYKEDDSPLTRADLLSHEILCSGLAGLGAGWPVLSEESAQVPPAERQSWRRYWLVDPLDGTREFLRRNDEFTVNIALIDDGVPVLGVVHVPVTGATYLAVQGQGAYREQGGGERVRLSVTAGPDHRDRAIRVVASRSHRNAATEAFLERLRQLRPAYQLCAAGSSLKMCLVAAGEAQLYPRLGPTMEWDTAAAQCVVAEAGGVLCDLEGNPLRYNKADLHNPHFVVADASGIPWRDCLP